MNEHSKQLRVKAYINPEIVNHNFLNGSWKLTQNGFAPQNVGKIHINPNFKRSVSTLASKSKPSNLVHINPNFLNGPKNSLVYVENNAIFQSNNQPTSSVNDLNPSSFQSLNCDEEIIECNIKSSFQKEKSRNDEAHIFDLSNTEALLDTTGKLNYNVAAMKTSLYSWRKTENNKSTNVQPKEHFSKTALSFGNHSLLKSSNKFAKISYKPQCKTSRLQLHNQFKYVKEKKFNKFNQIQTRPTTLFMKKSNPIYASRTKIINRKLADMPSKAKIKVEAQKLLQMKKNLQNLKLKILNASKLSPTIKSAASVRAKYKYNKLHKNRLCLKQDKKFLNVSTKFKLDKRNITDEKAKASSACRKQYKIEKLFPNSIKLKNYSWNKSFNLWTKENFNPPVYSWKNKQMDKNLKKIAQSYPNRTLVKIGGIWYKSSQSKLTRTKTRRKSTTITSDKQQFKSNKTMLKRKGNHVVYVRGEKFILDKSGKSLRRHPNQKQSSETKPSRNLVNRVDLGGVTYLRKSNNILIRTNTHHARYVVNHAKHKSIALLSSLRKRNNMPCMIYTRLGKCVRHSKGLCSYNHDRKNVILCKKFLKNQCNDGNCLLSHEVVQEKVATCHFFLKGCCNNENCTYLHVKVNSKAPICKNFLQGFCSSGKDCLERHVYACPEFDKNEKCSRRDKCPYPHRPKSDHKIQKSKTWTKNKGKSNAVRKSKIKGLELAKSKGSQDLGTKKPKRTLLIPKGSNLAGEQKSEKSFGLSNSSNLSDTEISENIEFIPKRIKLDNLPCFIPLNRSHEES